VLVPATFALGQSCSDSRHEEGFISRRGVEKK
jgi:hypothetical protein